MSRRSRRAGRHAHLQERSAERPGGDAQSPRQRRRHPEGRPAPDVFRPASAGQTVVSFTLRPVEERGPWPLTRVLTALGEFEVERVDVARALGDRQGIPLIHSQQLRWRDLELFVEARHGRDGLDELSIELPPWDDVLAAAGSDIAWRLLDTVAAASDARFGCIGDGEPPETALADGPASLARQLRRHLALLLPEWTSDDVGDAGAAVQRTLPSSGLLVVTG